MTPTDDEDVRGAAVRVQPHVVPVALPLEALAAEQVVHLEHARRRVHAHAAGFEP
eukprot:gene35740-58739_t